MAFHAGDPQRKSDARADSDAAGLLPTGARARTERRSERRSYPRGTERSEATRAGRPARRSRRAWAESRVVTALVAGRGAPAARRVRRSVPRDRNFAGRHTDRVWVAVLLRARRAARQRRLLFRRYRGAR